ncbi:hypothetical protein [Streptomyces griseofuscus]|uniref:hypothetical protein n=1 Tax=Streptomyces griseofuscus TaxID=146922 RepID=UPI00367B2A73
MNEQQILTTLCAHAGRFGSPIHRLATTGEITEHTHPALHALWGQLTLTSPRTEEEVTEHRTPCPSGRHHAHRMQTCEQYEKWRRDIEAAISQKEDS